MEIDGILKDLSGVWAQLSDRERRYLTRVALKQCLYCGSLDHKVDACPSKNKKEGKGKAQFQH